LDALERFGPRRRNLPVCLGAGQVHHWHGGAPPIIARCGGKLIGYFLPKEGANNLAVALIDFQSLSEYEQYREHLAADPDARRNLAAAKQSRCILVEDRSFLRRV
jgi:hypothetical protein